MGDYPQPMRAALSARVTYVFHRDNAAGWTQRAKLKAFDATPFDNFGGYVAIDGTTILIGAKDQDAPSGTDEGAAYVYTDCR